MSGLILLDGILEQHKYKYPGELNDDELFELYCADNVLTNFDLSLSELELGLIDGPRDTGIDYAFLFVNRKIW
jgi:hypothetical protein